jgi:hypothetical protein
MYQPPSPSDIAEKTPGASASAKSWLTSPVRASINTMNRRGSRWCDSEEFEGLDVDAAGEELEAQAGSAISKERETMTLRRILPMTFGTVSA